LGDQLQEDEVGVACDKYKREDKETDLWENLKEWGRLGKLRVDGNFY
jgi:hypothetical protein